ncbi:membrane protein [Marinicauda pacifica]|uniref:Membrane protein YkvI n=1 Tax=Marinicauda pacifica TaxID=1133559 RepID=A0A4S2HE98_9PROT|nr:hypothetical protein [Marinicauda pacifica]TGY94193.1 hypothetical protein E5162_02645 [Marinicauda pacifica]GGE33731.1 membrane protein [Marinicauda pacifica]
MTSIFRTYLLPGLVFQSVIIGGGYGTGREIAEFFLSHGALGGLLGFAATAATWAVILALGFEFARIMKAYDYKTFFVALLGPFWRLFEILYVLIALLVLSVLGSAAGRMVAEAFGISTIAGSLGLLLTIGVLAFFGGSVIARVMAWWSLLLFALYAVFFVWVAISFGDAIASTLEVGQVDGGWLLDGVRYAAYNLVAFAAVLFVLPSLKTRREAILSGALAGAISVIPGVLVFVAMLARYPDIQQQAVPVVFLLQTLNVVWLSILFQVVLFGTFVETGVGIIHAINERIAAAMTASGRAFPHWARFVLAIVFLATAIFLAEAIGIIDLIAGGYGILSYAFIAIVVAPLLTIGLFKIAVAKEKQTEEHRVSCNQ